MLLKDVCTPNVVCCGPQTTAVEAASLMRHRHVGDLVVVSDPQEALRSGSLPIAISWSRCWATVSIPPRRRWGA